MWAMVLMVVLACHVDPEKTVDKVKCEIRQYSHGWKLTGTIEYTDKASVNELLTPGEGKVFFDDDGAAFAKCSEWRKCVLSEEKAKRDALKEKRKR